MPPSSPQNNPSTSILGLFFYAGYRVVEGLVKLFPITLVFRAGAILGQCCYYLFPSRRNIVIRNLKIAFGDSLDSQAMKGLAKQSFRRSLSNLIAGIQASSMPPQEIRLRVEVVGRENLQRATAMDHGVIALLCHMGNWELMAQLHTILPELQPSATLFRPFKNKKITQHVQASRGKSGTQFFSKKDGFSKPIQHLKSGGSLGVLADQHAGKSGVSVPFFGKSSSLSPLPAILHRRTGAPIVPISMETTGVGQWRVRILPPLEIPHHQTSDARWITSLCATAYESVMRDSPADVLWMHAYWKTGRRSPLKIERRRCKKTDSSTPQATNPFHILAYTGDTNINSETGKEMQKQLKRLKFYRDDLTLTTAGTSQLFDGSDHHLDLSHPSQPAKVIADFLLNHPRPIDCSLDFTRAHLGEIPLTQSLAPSVFSFTGRHQSSRTHAEFTGVEHPSLDLFLVSLGIEDHLPPPSPTSTQPSEPPATSTSAPPLPQRE